jgi:hypothetical protein
VRIFEKGALAVRRALVALGALVALSLAAPRPLLAAERSPLETSLIHQALKDFEAEEDPSPQGKIVDAIEVYVVDVFDARDPIPDW